jgi:hypothetical protein
MKRSTKLLKAWPEFADLSNLIASAINLVNKEVHQEINLPSAAPVALCHLANLET